MAAAVIGALIPRLVSLIEEGRNLRNDLKDNLQDLKHELDAIQAVIRGNSERCNGVSEAWIKEMQELAYDIDDCIDQFVGKVTRVPEGSSVLSQLSRVVHKAKSVPARTEFAEKIKKLKDRAVIASQRRDRYNTDQVAVVYDRIAASSSQELTGFDQPKEELLELLQDATMQLRVISIVGCRGLGKTALARAVYESNDVTQRFPCRAWVEASKYSCNDVGVRDLLRKILQQVEQEEISSQAPLQESLRQVLRKKERYLIILDDMINKEVWDIIKCAFPDKGTNDRIILTTTIGEIARNCSFSGGSVYNLQALSKDDSNKLLLKLIFESKGSAPSDTTKDLEGVLNKCDGLPLALVSFGKFLKDKVIDQPQMWEDVRDVFYLGSLLGREGAFERMMQSFMESYNSLAAYDLKSCLLYVSIFPEGHAINRKSLVRQWLAEELVAKEALCDIEKIADEYFYQLIDRNIIKPVDVRNNSNVKTCQVRGMMLDFIVLRSVKENFVALMRDDKLRKQDSPCATRRLSIHHTNKGNAQGGGARVDVDLSHIRSLAIFEQNVQDLVDFRKCKSLRVLDLENCNGLKDSFFDDICRLLQLRYLNLRGANVKRIPKKVSKLQHLETLDVRSPPGTRTALLLPMEVLTLPRLAHLFGRFQLPDELNRGTLKPALEDLLKKSILQTLAGFVIDERKGFKHIMLHMSKLVKVKIWSATGSGTSGPTSETTDMLVASLGDRFYMSMALQSLSVDFGGKSIDFLCSLDPHCVQRSVKLRGRLSSVPAFFESHHNLIELCLFSVGLTSQNLSALQGMRLLLYLKVVEDRKEFGAGPDGSFHVRSDGFKSLMKLCFSAPKLPNLSIEEGAMPKLASLQLLSEDEQGPAVITNIACLQALKEVTLSSSVSELTKNAWVEEAKKNTNKPTVKFSAPSANAPRSP